MDNYVGKRLDGRYEIQEIIGVGGMSVVYKAYDNLDDRIVAVKILKEEFLANEEFRRRFKNESKAIAVLSHPNIVKVFDVSFGEKLQYIVMEYVDGITLKEYIQQQKVLEWREAVHFTTQILRALQHAHDKGIVHRDIKPQNIMLLQDGSIKVADFGIARFSRSETRTMTESAIGSVHYISPEQARGEITDEKADIYSVGVVLYEMITGQVPFQSDSAVSVAIMQLQAEPKLPTQLNPQIPLGLEQITMHAMQKVPSQRYQTATEMLLDMDELSRTPNATFEYSYFVDRQPTKYATSGVPSVVPPAAMPGPIMQEPLDVEGNSVDTSAEDAARNKKKIAIIAGCTVLVIALIIGLVVFLSKGMGGGKLTVPDFVGKDYAEEIVTQYQDGKQFAITPKFETTDDASKIGKVLEQSVPKGTKVAAGTAIELTIGTSNSEVDVPAVSGLTLEEASNRLKQSGFINLVVSEIANSEVEKGYVVSTEPKEFTKAKTSDQIIILVSTGKSNTTFEMPSLVNLTLDQAKKVIEVSGLAVGTVTATQSDKPKDTVISHDPKEKDMVQTGMKVNLTISTGTGTTTKPAKSKVNITMALPNTGSDGELKIYLNNEWIETKTVRLTGGTYTFAVEGQGASAAVQVTINGKDYMRTTVNFDTQDPGVPQYEQFADETVSIPTDLAGKTYEEAKAQLDSLGLIVKRKDESSTTVEANHVIRYTPKFGKVKKGTTITLTVSTGPSNA